MRFDTEPGDKVAVPWKLVHAGTQTYEPEVSPQSGSAPAAFGNLDVRELKVNGAVLRIVLLKGKSGYDPDALTGWIQQTTRNLLHAYGRFPNPQFSVFIIPVVDRSRNSDAVIFGRVVRDGGEAVELLVNPASTIERLTRDWTATHEFSHLMLPYVARDERWISEGFAQYYQNVLLARAGQYTPQYAWQKLFEGFERGRHSMPNASPDEAAASDSRNARMKVYWSGAAIALLADVELRQHSGSAVSLDTVLGNFQLCCLPSNRTWSGAELFAKLDTLIAEPIFSPLYERYADTSGFPDVDGLLQELGVRVRDSTVALSDEAALAAIRRQIMTPRDPGEY